jgi:hypothetical protein
MEPSGCNRWQRVANAATSNTAQIAENRCRGLPSIAAEMHPAHRCTSESPVSGMPKRKAPAAAGSSDGTLPGLGRVSQRRQRRLERRLPRRLWRSRWARRFPMAEPACLAISSRKARSGSQRISKRHPASSHHKDRVHTLAPRPTRGIGFNGGTGATKKRPACARRSASVALFGHTPTTTCRSVTIGQVKLAGQRRPTCQRSPQHPVNPATKGHRRARLTRS